MSSNAYRVTILPNGAIPTDMLSGGKEHNKDTAAQQDSSREVALIEQIIHLKKQIRSLKTERDTLKSERDAYKQYVPSELLSFGTLVNYTPRSTGDEKTEAGQITDDD